MKFLIIGSGGRESAFAMRLAKDSQLYAVMHHKNYSIVDCVESSGGRYMVGDADDPSVVLRFAQENNIDYTFVSADRPACKWRSGSIA